MRIETTPAAGPKMEHPGLVLNAEGHAEVVQLAQVAATLKTFGVDVYTWETTEGVSRLLVLCRCKT